MNDMDSYRKNINMIECIQFANTNMTLRNFEWSILSLPAQCTAMPCQTGISKTSNLKSINTGQIPAILEPPLPHNSAT